MNLNFFVIKESQTFKRNKESIVYVLYPLKCLSKGIHNWSQDILKALAIREKPLGIAVRLVGNFTNENFSNRRK